MNIKINGKKQEVDFWDFFKSFCLSYAVLTGILILIGMLIGITI